MGEGEPDECLNSGKSVGEGWPDTWMNEEEEEEGEGLEEPEPHKLAGQPLVVPAHLEGHYTSGASMLIINARPAPWPSALAGPYGHIHQGDDPLPGDPTDSFRFIPPSFPWISFRFTLWCPCDGSIYGLREG